MTPIRHATAILASIVITFTATNWLFGNTPPKIMFLAWSVAFINYGLSCILNTTGIGENNRKFFIISIGFNSMRFICFLISIFVAIKLLPNVVFGYCFSTLTAVSVFKIFEVYQLHLLTIKHINYASKF